MVRKRLSKENTLREYRELQPKYERIATLLEQVVRSFVTESQIEVLDVTSRVKEFDSLWDKIQRKRYSEPFNEIEDLCGIRIVCFYPSDLDKIGQIIKDEFVVTDSVDKAELLAPDRFGYRSIHFIVTLKDEWLTAPQYRGLGNLKAEIQVRTILMHAWAGLSHKLAYKKKEQIPDRFQRKLFQLSAMFEAADEQFDNLQKEKSAYQEELVKGKSESATFDARQPLNVDTLQAYLDSYFPSRPKSVNETSNLLEEITPYRVSIKDLVFGYERCKDLLPSIEQEAFGDTDQHWAQVGIARIVLQLTHDRFWDYRRGYVPEKEAKRSAKWRKQVKK